MAGTAEGSRREGDLTEPQESADPSAAPTRPGPQLISAAAVGPETAHPDGPHLNPQSPGFLTAGFFAQPSGTAQEGRG